MCKVKKHIKECTAASLNNYRLAETNEHIPLLKEVLELVNGSVPLLIEIKGNQKIGRAESELVRLLENYQGEVAVQSFNPFQWPGLLNMLRIY